MKIARIEHAGGTAHAVVEDGAFRLIEGDIFGEYRITKETVTADDARLLAPTAPPQIVAIGRNYREHAAEGNAPVPDAPLIFLKACSAVNNPGDAILLPGMAPDQVDYEAELVVVIGKAAKHVPEDRADNYILGYTCGNDVSARDCQGMDSQWARGKSFDTFAPLGPWIETDLDPTRARIRLELNGQVMQDGNSADMVFGVRYLVSYLSRCMTLLPGSVIMTGTPSGVGAARKPPVFLRDGDTVTVEIEGIGKLTNPVKREE